MFWGMALGLSALSALCILWPMFRKGGDTASRSEGAMAIFKDQLAEIDRDAARELISEADAQAARVEIKRRMLAADQDRTDGHKTGGAWALVVMACLTPLGAAGVYTLIGAPGVPSLPFAERADEQEDATELAKLTETLRKRLGEQENGGETEGWDLLARTYMNMQRFGDARAAWEQIINRPEATTATWSRYAETLISMENGIVTPRAEEAIEKSLQLDASNPAAIYYRAIALDQAGQTVDARNMLLRRIAQESAEQVWMGPFLDLANRMGEGFGLDPVGLPEFPESATRGPTAEDRAAAADLSPEERMEFIESMVTGLAERLEDEPENLDGWLQLARAYVVLGRQREALEALKSAKPLVADLAESDPKRQAVEQGLAELSE